MSLRARDQKVYFIACDGCGRQSAADLMPVGAEARAGAAGWAPQPDLRKHTCPTCTPVPATPPAGR